MKTRKIKNLTVSEIGTGCMGFSHGYGKIPDEDYSIEAIRKAYDAGCTFFDTAEIYGPNLEPQNKGHNEKIVGKAIKDFRKNIVLATKLHIPTEEAKTDGVYKTLRDLYYLHRINPSVAVEEVAEGMGQLIKDGLIKGWGLSQVPVKIIDRAQKITPLTAIQNIYSMVERGVEEEVIPYCLKNDIGLVAFSPISSGLLSGKVTTKTEFEKVDDVRNFVPQLKKENLAANQPIIDLIERFAKLKNATNAQIALAWMLHKYPNVVPIPGSKNQGRILENLGANEVEFTDTEFKELDSALNACTVYGYRGYDESEGKSFLDKDDK